MRRRSTPWRDRPTRSRTSRLPANAFVPACAHSRSRPTRVEIDGYGEWVVLDRMAPRWRRTIDLYLGDDDAAAKEFGKRSVTIRWGPK